MTFQECLLFYPHQIRHWVTYLIMKETKKEISPEIYQEIVEAVQHLKFGEVVITVYDSKVVQIEKKEKKRFT